MTTDQPADSHHDSSGGAPGRLAAVVLAGGRSRRMGGIDKTRLPVRGAPALERVLRALQAVELAPAAIVVAGPQGELGQHLTERYGARFVREDPPCSGPLAALAAGARAAGAALDEQAANRQHPCGEGTILVLGGDMPLLRPETLTALAERSRSTGSVTALASDDGTVQFLGAAWPAARLSSALAAVREPGTGFADLSLKRLYAQLGDDELLTMPVRGAEDADIDTPEDLDAVRAAAGPRVAIAQIEVSENPHLTEQRIREAAARAAEGGARLLLLPEAVLTPFGTDLYEAAVTRSEAFDALLQELAEQHRLVIVAGSFTPADAGRVHNTVLVRGPGGTPHAEYRKIHLFDAFGSGESRTVAPGDQLVTIELDGTCFGIATCYDIRFPEQFTALARRGAHAILVPVAWAAGAGKREQLQLLLRARALDSTSIILAADQSAPEGYDGTAPRGIGHSAAIGPLGSVRAELGADPGMLLVDLDLTEVAQARRALPVLEHAVEIPSNLA